MRKGRGRQSKDIPANAFDEKKAHQISAQALTSSLPSKVLSPEEIVQQLNSYLTDMQSTHSQHASQLDNLSSQIESSTRLVAAFDAERTRLAKKYASFQDMKDFIQDLCDCLAEKVSYCFISSRPVKGIPYVSQILRFSFFLPAYCSFLPPLLYSLSCLASFRPLSSRSARRSCCGLKWRTWRGKLMHSGTIHSLQMHSICKVKVKPPFSIHSVLCSFSPSFFLFLLPVTSSYLGQSVDLLLLSIFPPPLLSYSLFSDVQKLYCRRRTACSKMQQRTSPACP